MEGIIEALVNLDVRFFLFLNGINSSFWDPIMYAISGKLIWIPMYAIIAFFMVKKYQWGGVWLLVGVALVVTLADQSSVQLFKNVFQRLRPCHNPNILDQIHMVSDRCRGGMYGFVSSHAANTFAVAAYLSCIFRNRPFQIFIISWAAIVSYSRIYLGVHYPADVAVGALLGLACGFVIWKLVQAIDKRYGIIKLDNIH